VGVCVSMVFWRGCNPAMGRPWCELQITGEWTLGLVLSSCGGGGGGGW
jgi:hypothetical protein